MDYTTDNVTLSQFMVTLAESMAGRLLLFKPCSELPLLLVRP